MLIFEFAIALLLAGALLSLIANRIGVPYPALLALAGAGLALIRGAPEISLDPGLALALFVAPVLLDAAFDASPRDMKDNLRPIANVAVVTVLLTIAAVACAARAMVPQMPWAVAIALGAIVAPSDASAATAVLRRLRPPHRLLVVLEGESLFNDAIALLVYRIAVGAAMTGVFSPQDALLTLVLTSVGGVAAGYVLARLFVKILTPIEDIAIQVLLQFISTFAVWIIADRLHLSAIIAVVAYAMTLARTAPGRIDGRHRIASYAVWEVAVFVLNALAFLLVGLQLRGIQFRLHTSRAHIYLVFALAICAVVILVRIAWWMSNNAFARWRIRRRGANSPRPMTLPTVGTGLVVSWCGMRGIVTLAAALALPAGATGEAFPYRDLLIFAAFCVVLATLVLQGMTLGPLLKLLGLKDDGTVEREILLARRETAQAALAVLENADHRPSADLLRREYEARARAPGASDGSRLAALQQDAVNAQRARLSELREQSIIGDDAFHAAEEEIDLLDLTADARIRPDQGS